MALKIIITTLRANSADDRLTVSILTPRFRDGDPAARHAIILLNHWAEFKQTCYMTSRVVRVCESNIIFRPSIPSVRRSVRHAIS